jgi:hypothetical protein
MNKILLNLALLISTGVSPLLANVVTLKSPRSTFVLHVPSKWINSEAEIDVVRIQKENVKGSKDTVMVLLDSRGVQTVSVPQGFPLKVSFTRPSVEFPFTLVVFERQKEGIETELIDAVALKERATRFLNAQEYGILAGTHASIPATIDALNKELNDLRK